MGTALRWWEMRGMPRATARAATLALLAAIALLHLWVVLFWRRAAAPRGAVLDAEARAGVGLSTRRDAGYDASPNVRGFVDANALVINPETYVRDRHERNVGRRLTQVPAEERREVDDYHYVFSADCKPYMDWQSVALYRSWQNVGSPGVMTRLLSCDERTLASYEYLDLMPTHVTPRYDDIDPGDDYAAYNLPGSMLHFVEHAQDALATKWIVKLDADMILRKPLTVTQGGLTAGPGVVAAGFYGYLAGVDNEMAGMFVDDAETRSRLAKVGGWEIFHAPDLARAAPLWFEYTKRVRRDKRVWWPFKGTGDVFITEANPRPWISEMYGYVFGAAVAGLRHNVVHSCQLYAGMAPWDDDSFDPFLIHYGIRIEIPDPSGSASERSDEKSLWAWDKHGELQGGPDARDKLSCAIPFAPFPEVPERLVPTPATDGKTLTRGNAETRRVEIVRELMIALNDGVRWHRARACGETSEKSSGPGKTSFPERKADADARAAADGVDVVICDENVGGDCSTSTSVRRSSLLTGAYIGAVGLALLVAPAATFSILFKAADITSAWIRVFGVLCVTFGAYYVGTPLYELRGFGAESFYRSTVLGRAFVFASLCVLAAFERRARVGLIALGVINALSASVMHRALERGRDRE